MGRRLYGLLLLLLPKALRADVAAAMLEVFDAAQREAVAHGPSRSRFSSASAGVSRRLRLLPVWFREFRSVLVMAIGSRRRDAWSARTDLLLGRDPDWRPDGPGGSWEKRGAGMDTLVQDVR